MSLEKLVECVPNFSEGQNKQVIDQITVLRGAGAGGFVLFDLDGVLAMETLPILGLGITAEK